MPTVNLQTNVPVDSVVTSDILKDASKTVARILGKPESVSVMFEMFDLVWFVCCEAPRVFLGVVYVYFLFYFFPRKHEGRSLMPRARSLLFQVIVGRYPARCML
jgi:hypothetical protein